MKTSLTINVPDSFDFRTAVEGHGWCDLAPFSRGGEPNLLLRYMFVDEAGAVGASISERGSGGLTLELDRPSLRAENFAGSVRHMLRLDEDFADFYAAIECDPRLRWIPERKAGRLLRSPTVWEDLVKTLCTTNCSWALTKIMVRNLVEKLGASSLPEPPTIAGGQSRGDFDAELGAADLSPANAGGSAFPPPAAMAAVGEDFYRTEIRAGYRSPFFVELAQRVASGNLDPEAWLTSELPTTELKKEMKKVKGVGDYAAENLLKLVGRYDGLALDSWLRSQFYKHHNAGEQCGDKQIVAHYEKFGSWRGLAIWCDMSEKWVNDFAPPTIEPTIGN
jgi:3-methyladenine DNA glycosylase/8-oxoguanine DNA glycosylase